MGAVDLVVMLITAVLGSSSLSVGITVWVTRRKTHVETVEISVKTALALEERAHSRYTSTADALVEAEHLLGLARYKIKELEEELLRLQRILLDHGITFCPEVKEASDGDAQ